jgi:hypothetical protein
MAAGLALARAARVARRAYPVAVALYQRWQALPEDQKERYKERARQYGVRGRDAGLRLFAAVQDQAAKRGRGR